MASQNLLHHLVDYFDVDLSFLRRNDAASGTTTLVAEWPPRPDIPDPDPLGVVCFADADPVFAATEHLSSVMLTRPDGADDRYQERVREASGIQGGVSSATVPLLDANCTVGVLGFIKYGDRDWDETEINALRAVASLLAQLQARVTAEERLLSLAFHDELTGLANRRGLVGYLTRAIEADSPDPVAVIFLDVDRLKAVNSFFGHAAGDQFLRTLASRLDGITADEGDHLLGRLGGDEFVLALSACSDERAAVAIAERLRRAAREPINVGGEEIIRPVSFGVALGTPGELTASELMGRADQAMMQSKARGGDEISVFTEEMRRLNKVRNNIELHLGTAIRNGSLILHYQPEVDLVTGSVLSVEALVRWPHPTLGLLQPGSFVDIVEATNLGCELGRWVIETGCRQLAEWHRRYPELGLSVNVSPAQLISLDLVSTVTQILQSCNLRGTAAHRRNHRARVGARHRSNIGHTPRPQRARRQNRRRRLRHRIQFLRPAEISSVGYPQDRSRIRPRPRGQRPRSGDRPIDHQPGRRLRTATGCRRSRNRSGSDDAVGSGMHPGAGIPLRQTVSGLGDRICRRTFTALLC